MNSTFNPFTVPFNFNPSVNTPFNVNPFNSFPQGWNNTPFSQFGYTQFPITNTFGSQFGFQNALTNSTFNPWNFTNNTGWNTFNTTPWNTTGQWNNGFFPNTPWNTVNNFTPFAQTTPFSNFPVNTFGYTPFNTTPFNGSWLNNTPWVNNSVSNFGYTQPFGFGYPNSIYGQFPFNTQVQNGLNIPFNTQNIQNATTPSQQVEYTGRVAAYPIPFAGFAPFFCNTTPNGIVNGTPVTQAA